MARTSAPRRAGGSRTLPSGSRRRRRGSGPRTGTVPGRGGSTAARGPASAGARAPWCSPTSATPCRSSQRVPNDHASEAAAAATQPSGPWEASDCTATMSIITGPISSSGRNSVTAAGSRAAGARRTSSGGSGPGRRQRDRRAVGVRGAAGALAAARPTAGRARSTPRPARRRRCPRRRPTTAVPSGTRAR